MEIAHPSTTVLFIDGRKDDRQYWVQQLKISSPDYLVLEAGTGAAGLAICRSHRVDCVISELTLADMSGFEVLVKLIPHASHPKIGFIFLTRSVYPMRNVALSNGAQAYLIKSHSSGDELDSTIQKALANVVPSRKELRS